MIELTPSAAKEIRRIISENSMSDHTNVRIGIKGGGCAGFTYVFDFDETIGDFDRTFESEGLKVVSDRKSLLYIDGTVIDFKTGLNERGFKFNNPKADTSCGCGTTFLPKDKPLF